MNRITEIISALKEEQSKSDEKSPYIEMVCKYTQKVLVEIQTMDKLSLIFFKYYALPFVLTKSIIKDGTINTDESILKISVEKPAGVSKMKHVESPFDLICDALKKLKFELEFRSNSDGDIVVYPWFCIGKARKSFFYFVKNVPFNNTLKTLILQVSYVIIKL